MTDAANPQFAVQAIGVVRSCFREKFGVPRQGGLVPSAVAEIELLPPFNRREWVDGLQQASHIWVLFWFHLSDARPAKSSVRPPRMGGNERMGVFATRSMFRPNPIGLSALELLSIEDGDSGIRLRVRGGDMVDGTPVIDIKPYVPYCDSLPQSRCDWAPSPPAGIEVVFAPDVAIRIEQLQREHVLPMRDVVVEMIAQDPRPAFHRDDAERVYGARLWQWNVRWRYDQNAMGELAALVVAIEDVNDQMIDTSLPPA